jgi:hypothetical protein
VFELILIIALLIVFVFVQVQAPGPILQEHSDPAEMTVSVEGKNQI